MIQIEDANIMDFLLAIVVGVVLLCISINNLWNNND